MRRTTVESTWPQSRAKTRLALLASGSLLAATAGCARLVDVVAGPDKPTGLTCQNWLHSDEEMIIAPGQHLRRNTDVPSINNPHSRQAIVATVIKPVSFPIGGDATAVCKRDNSGEWYGMAADDMPKALRTALDSGAESKLNELGNQGVWLDIDTTKAAVVPPGLAAYTELFGATAINSLLQSLNDAQ